ncbi:MAG TPA: hypothetical protein VFE97_00005 [Methylomirabilota bacterium]|nr:hypothetical protein [Methylomirabilota bacterium]
MLPYYDAAYHHQLAGVTGRALAVLDADRPSALVAADVLAAVAQESWPL